MNQKRPLHFLFTSTLSGGWAGSEWLWSDAARALQARGHRVDVLLPWRKKHATIEALVAGGSIIHAPGQPRRFWRRWLSRLQSAETSPLMTALATNPDLIVLSQDRQDRGGELASILAGRRYAIVNQLVTEHNYWEDAEAERVAELYRHAAASYFVAPANLRTLESLLGESLPRASVVRNPFRVPYDRPLPLAPGPRAALALVGRLDPDHKGHDVLLEALARPVWRERDWVLNFFGDGSARNRIRKQIARLGLQDRVKLRGHVDSPTALWSEAQVALFPSRCEGTPIALVEAMLMGRPALATDVGGNADFTVEGRTGWLAAAPHPDLLAAALERMWADRVAWPRLGEAAAVHARNLVPADPAARWADALETLARNTG